MAKNVQRRLAAILAADVVGYSRLMGEDEAGTMARLEGLKAEILVPMIAQHHGRVVKLMGDGFLVEFASVVDALTCALAWQEAVETRADQVSEDRALRFRIGVNLGDVMVKDDDLYGEGVNVAARLEGLAEPGSVLVSRTVFNHAKGKVAAAFEDLGEQELKNIAEPVRVFRVSMASEVAKTPTVAVAKSRSRLPVIAATVVLLVVAAGAALWLKPWEPREEPASIERMAFPLPDRPSIAVLPFTNMSGDPAQDTFADGMTDDLITDLSKISDLFVIARNSTFAYKGGSPDVREVAEDLGVRYVLEGSVRRVGDDVRVNAQLIDAMTGGHVWAERYDGNVTDIFAVQDAFVRKIVGALALNLSAEEQEEIARGQSANIEAREAFQKGWEHYFRFTPADNAKAAEHLKRAVELDPAYGRAYSALGMVYVRGCQWRWNAELGMSVDFANSTAQNYLSEGKKHSSSLTNVAASQISLYNGEYDKAFTEAARAISLDPNDPEAHVAMGLATITTGRPEAGLEFVETALRLNPSHPNHYVLAHGMAYFAMDDLEQAAAVLKGALDRDPSAVELAPLLAASYAHLGRREEARAALLQYRPDASQSELQDIGFAYHFPYNWPADNRIVRHRITDGMFIAGLPLETTVPTLADTLRQEDALERQRAAQALGRFGPAAADAVPALIETLGEEVSWLRKDAVIALGKIGPAAEAAIPALTAMQDEGVDEYYVNQALKKIRGY